ncbi:MAG: T9SS type A sorting domain-containing protein [Bacteroidales bacterium]|nr:T9SS type A sorting domain-containing protein [Bacteroidales bacterium]
MKKILLSILMITSIEITYCQSISREVNASAGEYFINSNSSISWTLGEIVTETFVSDDNTLTQGFQQSLLYVFIINENADSIFNINVYPNPTNSILNINIDSKIKTSISIKLFDIHGNCLFDKEINGNKNFYEKINLSNYRNSMYLLKIISSKNKFVKSYKIQKVY